ncbi:MAG: cyclic nucleotide-binding domain-containing protein [Candidatus Thiodiazotropha sp. (ex Dulcina madagascariensis)]|nr:cyclic nucleotide-binding domain-containing protein [Candidatus Thiodiazotropha sp. (ex Dulcina madagascariensis)]MCU7925393.1 cyclic nucleotide-binding domain-containing protein [Candidatus Thiodiazotropha sp. (ex Dulcina madagascariensis)]
MQQARLGILQEMPIFGGIEEAVLNYLLSKASTIQLSRGDFFFREGDLDNSIYILQQGSVAVYRSWQGRQYKLRRLAKGDCFGEMALMDCKPRSAEVIALEDCSAIQITAAQLADLYHVNPEQYTMIYMNLGREVCRRLREADTRLFISERSSSTVG